MGANEDVSLLLWAWVMRQNDARQKNSVHAHSHTHYTHITPNYLPTQRSLILHRVFLISHFFTVYSFCLSVYIYTVLSCFYCIYRYRFFYKLLYSYIQLFSCVFNKFSSVQCTKAYECCWPWCHGAVRLRNHDARQTRQSCRHRPCHGVSEWRSDVSEHERPRWFTLRTWLMLRLPTDGVHDKVRNYTSLFIRNTDSTKKEKENDNN